jgi:hypothetical protein
MEGKAMKKNGYVTADDLTPGSGATPAAGVRPENRSGSPLQPPGASVMMHG